MMSCLAIDHDWYRLLLRLTFRRLYPLYLLKTLDSCPSEGMWLFMDNHGESSWLVRDEHLFELLVEVYVCQKSLLCLVLQ